MNNINQLKNSYLKHLAKIYKISQNILLKIGYYLFLSLGFLSILYLINYYFDLFNKNNIYLGLSYIFLSFLFLIVSFNIYYKIQIINHKPKRSLLDIFNQIKQGKNINLIDYLSINSYLSLSHSIDNNQQIDNVKLLKSLAKVDKIKFIISRMGISPDYFLKKLDKFNSNNTGSKTKLNIILKESLKTAIAEDHNTIETGDLFIVLSRNDNFLKNLIFNLNIKSEDLAFIVNWETTIRKEIKNRKFNPDNIKRTGGIGKDWSAGYTLALSRYAYDLTKSISKGLPIKYNAHKNEISKIEKILSRSTHHNTMLIGEPGVGKESTVLLLAKKIYEGNTTDILKNKKIMRLNTDYLLAGANNSGEILRRLISVMQDAVYAGNIIIFIDNIHKLFGGTDNRIGSLDASEILLPFLENPNLFIISTTSLSKYHQAIETKKAVVEKIETININEPNEIETLKILQENVPNLEFRHHVLITFKALNSVIKLSDAYMYDRAFPEKAILLLEEVSSSAPSKSIISENSIENLITRKTGVPVGELGIEEKQKLLNLESILHKRVIGQNEAIKEISNAMRRARTGIKSTSKPIGSFLFLGPTGVGKTETAKALAEAYFTDENKIIRFDMSEYQEINSINRFIGAPAGTPGADTGGELTNAIKDNPFSLILFDEIEKAHPNILNLFLQLLDEGRVTDSIGRKVKFTNSIIIATSNAGAEFIRNKIKDNISANKLKFELLNYLQQEKLFRPEFLNRFTGVISFKPLTPSEVLKITKLLINSLVKDMAEEKDIIIKISLDAINLLAQIGYDPTLGARPIKRTIQDKVENLIAKKLLSGEISKGGILNISKEDIEISKI